ncbi:MAG: hypothetical protein AAGH92_05810 [Planctomycetota bacterium]
MLDRSGHPEDNHVEPPSVVLVGHCGFDSGGLQRTAQRALPNSKITSTHRLDELERHADAGALLLINRVPEGSFQGMGGLELITHLHTRAAEQEKSPLTMLVSDLPDAQAAAEAAGALPGFGKSRLSSPDTHERLRSAFPASP